MPSLNRAILCGHSGDVAEVRYTKSGKAVANFSLATNDGWGDNKQTNWHKVTCWDKTAEFIGEYLTKGAVVLLEGRIQYREHEGKYYTDIVADKVELIKNEQAGGSQSQGSSAQASNSNNSSDEFEDDDIPF